MRLSCGLLAMMMMMIMMVMLMLMLMLMMMMMLLLLLMLMLMLMVWINNNQLMTLDAFGRLHHMQFDRFKININQHFRTQTFSQSPLLTGGI